MLFPWITVISMVLGRTHARSAPTPASKTKAPTPLVDPGLFVIQGISTCQNGTGYCMLGHNCEVDVDFLPTDTGGHCDGLKEAFTPRIHFICCKYNPNGGNLTTTPPPTTIAPYTITDVFNIIDEQAIQEQPDYDENGIPEGVNPEDLIDIVGVVTDTTGVIGLITQPWTGTFPTRSTTTPMPPTSKSTTTMKTTTTTTPATTTEED